MDKNKWLSFLIGYVFLTSGLMKLVQSDFKTAFINLGIPFPLTTLWLVAIVEFICGVFIVARMYVKLMTIPLLIIMIGAIFLTKLPLLREEGVLPFIFHARLDIVMIILLILVRYEKQENNH